MGGLLVQQGVDRLDRDLDDPPELAEMLSGLGDLPEIEPYSAAQVTAELRDELRHDLRSDLDFHAAVERLWPVLTPEQVLAELYASPSRLASAGGDAALYRATAHRGPSRTRRSSTSWPNCSVPRPADRRRPPSPTTPTPRRCWTSSRRPTGTSPARTPTSCARPTSSPPTSSPRDRCPSTSPASPSRAAADRDWRFGHLVVDEAQELSAMDWHVLLRRCPSHSITAVGDIAQRSAPAGARSWDDVLAPHLGSRWTYRTLTVNYRTPVEIMELAAAVLAEFAPGPAGPRVGAGDGEHPWQRSVRRPAYAARWRRRRRGWIAGTLAVIAADVGGLLDLPAEVHTPISAKGLEFDVVVIVDPERIRAHNPADLYVSLTRATQRLGLLHVER